MSYPSEHPSERSDDWLDAQLRAVQLPKGLHGRLARIASDSDNSASDASVPRTSEQVALQRDVIKPIAVESSGPQLALGKLAPRKLAIARLSDAQLDARLCDVPVPAELFERLRAIAAPAVRWRRLAIAASLFLAVSAAYFASVGVLVLSTYEHEVVGRERATLLAMIEGSGEYGGTDSVSVIWDPASADRSLVLGPEAIVAPTNRGEGLMPRMDLVEQALIGSAGSRPGTQGVPASINVAGRRPRFSDEFALADVRLTPNFAPASLGPTADVVSPTGISRDAVVHDALDARVVAGPRPRGVDLPLDHVTQRFFLLKYGMHPPLSPKEQPKSPVPLARSTAGFELWREYVARGQSPPADAVRTEDFLAAVDIGAERSPSRPLTVSMLGGPSPLGDGTGRLVQIGVQVRDFPEATHRPVHLTLAVDVSPNMRFGNRLEMVKRAIAGLARELGPADRLDLVMLHGRAEPLVEEIRREDEKSWRAAVAALEPESSTTGLAAGLMSALSVVQNGVATKGMLRKLMIIGDGAAEWDAASRGAVERAAAQAAAAGVTMSLVHLSPLGAPDPKLVEMVLNSKGRVWHAGSEDPIRWALRETISGRSQVVARDAKLTVSFNPKIVASYRLLGHEPVAVAGLMPARVEADLHAGQTAVALYEVYLISPPNTGGQPVVIPPSLGAAASGAAAGPTPSADVELASVLLQWREPRGSAAAQDGTSRQAGQKLMRSQLRGSLAESPPALQMAAMAATTAEVLRNSPFATNLTLADVLAWSRELRGPVTLQAAHREFMAIVERAEQIDAVRRGRRDGRGRP